MGETVTPSTGSMERSFLSSRDDLEHGRQQGRLIPDNMHISTWSGAGGGVVSSKLPGPCQMSRARLPAFLFWGLYDGFNVKWKKF